VLLLHGGQDRVAPSSHAEWLATRIRSAELWLHPDDGHISVLNSAEAALDWTSVNNPAGLNHKLRGHSGTWSGLVGGEDSECP
jgi:pimeloyl-ACP methyl ester carboxylesterase